MQVIRVIPRVLLAAVIAGCLVTASHAQPQPVVIQRSINLVNVWNQDNVLANDFHIRFKAKDLQNNPIMLDDLDPTGWWNTIPGIVNIDRNVTYDNGYVDIYYSWSPPICVNASNPGQFGYTLLGGVQYEDVQWNWTLNGAPVQTQDDVWQDWIKVWNGSGWDLQDVIRNRETTPRLVQRTSGYLNAPVTISDVALVLTTPPDPVSDPGPIVVNFGGTVVQPWPWPGTDPSYFMYYDLYDSTGTKVQASFRNVAVLAPVPEPGTLALLGAAAVVGVLWWRKKKG